MNVFYGGTEDFETRLTGDAMASALLDAVSAVDVALAARLVFDPESGGLEVGAPTERDLRVVLELGRQAGLLTASFVDGVEIDDLDELEALAQNVDVDEESEASLGTTKGFEGAWGGDFVAEVLPHAVTAEGVVGAFNGASYPRGSEPAVSLEGLAAFAMEQIAGEVWAREVHITLANDHVLVEAPDCEVLDRVARAAGTPGLIDFADDLFAKMRRDAGETAVRPVWEMRLQAGRWRTTGAFPAREGSRKGDPVRVSRELYARLRQADPKRESLIDLSVEPDWTVHISADRREDAEWVVAELFG